MKTVIIEDEKPSARRLKRMVETLQLEVVAMLHSVEESIDWFQNNPHPNLIFLDIQLSDGLSFEIFESIEISSSIIFTTAYDEYALKAFKLKSVDYLLKPIDSEELEQAVTKFIASNQTSKIKLDYNALKNLLYKEEKKTYKKRFTVKIGQHLKVFKTSEIECFYSENKGTYLHNTNNRNYLTDTTLDELEKTLNPLQFYRVSRNFFVHINAIKDIIDYSNSRLELKLNHFSEFQIIVSRERVKYFKEWLNKGY